MMILRFKCGIHYPKLVRLITTVLLLFIMCYIFYLKRRDSEVKDARIPNNYIEKSSPDGRQNKIRPASAFRASGVKYNLMEERYGKMWSENSQKNGFNLSFLINCTIDFANENQLEQDHPCVIDLIRRNYLRQPASKNAPYRLRHPELIDPSDGQSKAILRILRNQTNGFFIECGGYDGEFLSNTLYMERTLGWNGLIIEADKNAYKQLLARNRKAYTSPICLSTKPYPMQVIYNATVGTLSSILEENGSRNISKANIMDTTITGDSSRSSDGDIYRVQCFPLYSLLMAIGRTEVDYFGLDVEGSEYKILKSIPWNKLSIKTLTVEWNHTPEGETAITRLMENNGFIKFGLISLMNTQEVVYVQDFLEDYRIEYVDYMISPFI